MPAFTPFLILIEWLDSVKNSIKNFVKSSVLSLVVITIILLLLLNMDQALTLLIDMIEVKDLVSISSLALSILLINLLALALSHYPIYTYYAANLNNSAAHISWEDAKPFNSRFLKWYKVYIFTLDTKVYSIDRFANFLRYSMGVFIHLLWLHYVVKSFDPVLVYLDLPLKGIKWAAYLLMVLPLLIYYFLKRRMIKLDQELAEHKGSTQEDRCQENLNRYLIHLGRIYVSILFMGLSALLFTLVWGEFNLSGLLMLYLTGLLLVWNYLFFRLLRTKFDQFSPILNKIPSPFKWLLSWFFSLEKSQKYLSVFHLGFYLSAVVIVLTTIGSFRDARLLNGIPVLLAFLYTYYFLIANLGKYYFVAQQLNLQRKPAFRRLFWITSLLVTLTLITIIRSGEVRTHELNLIQRSDEVLSEDEFINNLKSKNQHRFFVASHGGGLKANAWTLLVMQELQKLTKGKFTDHTISFSGASGGSLGLALYTLLHGENGTNFDTLDFKIERIISDNYTTLDIALTFGVDSYRKLWPLNKFRGKDRPYYKMMRYQNDVLDRPLNHLDSTSFRKKWLRSYQKKGYFPSLIMNTAATNGKRGISWSVQSDHFSDIFPFAQNLADLEQEQTLSYYQAVSTTNRFPFLSPAAKVKGYGHFIDAGAIDNSGLLSNLDLFNYLYYCDLNIFNEGVTFIEIVNSKSLYAEEVVKRFLDSLNMNRLPRNEVETDNIIADLKTGLNLDKIPGYLADYLTNSEQLKNNLGHIRIFLPHKINLDDVESLIDGELEDCDLRDRLEEFLANSNNQIFEVTEQPENRWNEPWEYYEPTLSRHLNPSSIQYMRKMLIHQEVAQQIKAALELTQ